MVKKILMGTVDQKGFLKDIVKSGGVVNLERAVYAAELSKDHTVIDAIRLSRESIYDAHDTSALKNNLVNEDLIFPIPLPGLFQ